MLINPQSGRTKEKVLTAREEKTCDVCKWTFHERDNSWDLAKNSHLKPKGKGMTTEISCVLIATRWDVTRVITPP